MAHRTRIDQRGKHPELRAGGGVYADLHNTQFALEAERDVAQVI
jgi:hypothetical protein